MKKMGGEWWLIKALPEIRITEKKIRNTDVKIDLKIDQKRVKNTETVILQDDVL